MAVFGFCHRCGELRQLYFRWRRPYCIWCIDIKLRLPLLLATPLQANPNLGLLGPSRIEVDKLCPKCEGSFFIEALPANPKDPPIFICPACGHSYPVNYKEEKRLLSL